MIAFVLDVDGVVSPVHGVTAWGDDVDGGPAIGQVLVSPTLNAALDAIGSQPSVLPVWLTSWDPEMRAGMRFPGKAWADIGGPAISQLDPAAGWWKWILLDSWLDRHPAVDALVWCDDHLDQAFSDDVLNGPNPTRKTTASASLAHRGIRKLLIRPDATVGLTPHDIRVKSSGVVYEGMNPSVVV